MCGYKYSNKLNKKQPVFQFSSDKVCRETDVSTLQKQDANKKIKDDRKQSIQSQVVLLRSNDRFGLNKNSRHWEEVSQKKDKRIIHSQSIT